MITKWGYVLLLSSLIVSGCSEEKVTEDKVVEEVVDQTEVENVVEEEIAVETEIKTFGITPAEFKMKWEEITSSQQGLEQISSIKNEETIEAVDHLIYKAEITEYIMLQARINTDSEEIEDISIVTIPPEENQNEISLNVSLATGYLLAVVQPELTADQRGEIIITNLGLGLEGTDLNTIDKEYVLNDVSYLLKNMDGLLYFGVVAGDINEVRKAREDQSSGSTETSSEETTESEETAPPVTNSVDFGNPIANLDWAEVEAVIVEQAESDWPDDYEMQDYQVEEQTAAYNSILSLSIDNDIKEILLNNAYANWEYDFEMVLYEYEEQLLAYTWVQEQVLDTEVKKKIMDNAKQSWGDDYEMVKYEYEEQLEAYNN